MDPSTEKSIWRKRAAQKTTSLASSEEELRHSRRSDLFNDKPKHISQHAKLSREPLPDKLGGRVWDGSEKSLAFGDMEGQAIQQQRTRSEKDLRALDKEIIEAWEETSKGTGVHKIASIRRLEDAYEKRDEIRSTFNSPTNTNSDSTPKSLRSVLSFLEEFQPEERASQTRSAAASTTITCHSTRSIEKAQNFSHTSLRVETVTSTADIESFTISKATNTSVPWPVRSRGSHSETSLLSKRTRESGDFVHKKRTKSEQTLQNINRGRYEFAPEGSGKLADIPRRKSTFTVLQKSLPSMNRREDAQSVHPLRRKSSTAPDSRPIVKKRVRSINQYLQSRYSQRMSRKQNRTTSRETADEPVKNHSSKKRKRSNELGIRARLRPRLRDTVGIEKQGLSVGKKTAGLPRTRRIADEGTGVAKKLTVRIPADADMATDIRRYSQWPDDAGALVTTYGCLFPARYDFSGIKGFDWICPVRSCRTCFRDQRNLGYHFVRSHHSCLFNDNCDGTFTIIGTYKASFHGKKCPAKVKSKNPLPQNASPVVEPRPPPKWTTTQKKPFLEALKKASSHAKPNTCDLKTVDEMMLQTGFLAVPSAEASGASELSELSRTPSFQGTRQRPSEPDAYVPNASKPPDYSQSNKNTAHGQILDRNRREDASTAARDATKENWRLVRKSFTGKQFHPPKRGYFAALLSTPRSREITLRPGLRFVADQPKKVRLLLAHMTGEEPSVPCESCALGRGPFKKCVAISKAAAGETTNGITCCTNCASKRGLGHKCNVEDLMNLPAGMQKRKQHRGGPASASKEQASLVNNSPQVTRVDSHYTFAVHTLPVNGSLDLVADPLRLRLCSVAAGKVMVELEGNPAFMIGPHGMFKVEPEVSADVSNASEGDAVLHVSILKG